MKSQNRVTNNILALGLGLITVTVWTSQVTDPVNVTKLFLLGGFAFAAFGSILSKKTVFTLFARHKIFVIVIVLFILNSFIVLIASDAPLSQSLYGIYGRNNGFLLYLFLAVAVIGTLAISSNDYFVRFLWALAAAGLVNLVYALWVMAFGDFIGWNNPYGNLLGTLGNPNFIGSFFGMCSGPLFVLALSPGFSRKTRLISFILLPFLAVGIQQSHAVQGRVLMVANLIISMFFYLRYKFQSQIINWMYSIAALCLGALAIFGALQIGPLKELIYKTSVSLRGEYWNAAWATGLQNPWFGVGFDSFGDWFRRTRRESSLVLPGPDTVTNTAHNVFLDILAFGGFPLLILYVIMNFLILISIMKVLRKEKPEPIFLSLTLVWVSYQLQSLISINQIGLVIWGWIIGAAIVSYQVNLYTQTDKTGDSGSKQNLNSKKVNPVEILSPSLKAGVAGVVGLLIAVPPLNSDISWRNALLSGDAGIYEKALTDNFMQPLNSMKIDSMVDTLKINGLNELAYKYAKIAVEFNPESFNAWLNLSELPNISAVERDTAIDNLKRLDPLNPKLRTEGK
jgi:O-antigen ligase